MSGISATALGAICAFECLELDMEQTTIEQEGED